MYDHEIPARLNGPLKAVAVHEIRRGLSQELLLPAVEHGPEGGVDVLDARFPVHEQHSVGGVLEDRRDIR